MCRCQNCPPTSSQPCIPTAPPRPGPAARLQHAGGSRVGDDGDAGGEQEEPSAHGGRERQRRGGRR